MIPYFAFHHTSSISYYRHFSISKVFPIFRHSRIICEQTYFTICIVFANVVILFSMSIFLSTTYNNVWTIDVSFRLWIIPEERILSSDFVVVFVVFPVDTYIISRCFVCRKTNDFLLCLCCRCLCCDYIIHQNLNTKKYIFF